MDADFRRQPGAPGVDHFDLQGLATGDRVPPAGESSIGGPRPRGVAEGIDQSDDGDVLAGASSTKKACSPHMPPADSHASRPRPRGTWVEDLKKIDVLRLGNRLGNHGAVKCGRARRRVVLREPQKLDTAQDSRSFRSGNARCTHIVPTRRR